MALRVCFGLVLRATQMTTTEDSDAAGRVWFVEILLMIQILHHLICTTLPEFLGVWYIRSCRICIISIGIY